LETLKVDFPPTFLEGAAFVLIVEFVVELRFTFWRALFTWLTLEDLES